MALRRCFSFWFPTALILSTHVSLRLKSPPDGLELPHNLAAWGPTPLTAFKTLRVSLTRLQSDLQDLLPAMSITSRYR